MTFFSPDGRYFCSVHNGTVGAIDTEMFTGASSLIGASSTSVSPGPGTTLYMLRERTKLYRHGWRAGQEEHLFSLEDDFIPSTMRVSPRSAGREDLPSQRKQPRFLQAA